jgi:2,3-bisphosphoglycerate-independent phosphoglycerate mutase
MNNRPKQKYIVLLGDGMADWPIKELGDKTPLQYAPTPTFNALAKKSVIGLTVTTPSSMPPGSDICNLSVMGYDPQTFHCGRSSLEAASLGIDIGEHETTFRCNFVTLSDEPNYEDKSMVDYSAGEITTDEANELIAAMNQAFGSDIIKFYTGTSYRHIMLSGGSPEGLSLTPPHDISGRKIKDHLPADPTIKEIMKKSFDLLSNHPVNLDRVRRGLNPANSAWLWGQGKKTLLTPFKEKYCLKGGVISAVDLIKGIAKAAQMDVFMVEGATGNVHTNFMGKAKRAVEELKAGYEFVYLHVEAADESSHQNQLGDKITSIEELDRMAAYIVDSLQEEKIPFRLMILPDHPTPLATLTHSRDPVPFLIYDSQKELNNPGAEYSESYAKTTGILVDPGFELMDYFTNHKTF